MANLFASLLSRELLRITNACGMITIVLAEGINLHRSNVLINYDLPWDQIRLMMLR